MLKRRATARLRKLRLPATQWVAETRRSFAPYPVAFAPISTGRQPAARAVGALSVSWRIRPGRVPWIAAIGRVAGRPHGDFLCRPQGVQPRPEPQRRGGSGVSSGSPGIRCLGTRRARSERARNRPEKSEIKSQRRPLGQVRPSRGSYLCHGKGQGGGERQVSRSPAAGESDASLTARGVTVRCTTPRMRQLTHP